MKHILKSITYTVIFIISFTPFLRAQTTDSLKKAKGGKNLVKINLTAIPLNNYSFQYERAIGRKTSLGLGVNVRPESGLPLKSTVEGLVDDEDTWEQLGSLKTGYKSITPEIRFYMGKGVYRGFYIAPFAKFATYTAKLPSFDFEFEDEDSGISKTESIPLSGDIKTITGGLQFGAQWKLSKLFYLDWWILGLNAGTSKGKITGSKSLSEQEQIALQNELEDLELPLVETETTVDQNGARLDLKGPWGGLRGGISLGIRF